ncbi:glutamate 5-kinase [Shimia marina]|uniref:Glutamate 5-kinase n=1 Tax=Shimia marina TaxID=321267 RepID=A0A0P1ESZ7_9RHOB|nr:glutamate 5-kinase [Shimia marina]CUH53673.1 Glutamate 5-kinase [Shimia marina]SFD71389.1 glutamate 5-kinase [Shimia marina]
MATLITAKRVVIKIGSALLVDRNTGLLKADWLKALAADVALLKARGTDVVLVSSGSIALGRGALGLPAAADLSLDQSQAAAAVGQIRLARAYEEVLAPYEITTAQVLVTLEDSANRRRYLNSRATLDQLLTLGVVPIVNENDTVATDEIRYGDNDRLAAQIALTTGADHLILLSDVDGFYSANPMTDPNAQRFEVIETITPEIEDMAGEGVSGLSKGGMITKLMAAKTATAGGCAMAITEGSALRPIQALEQGANATWFTAEGTPQLARKRWITSMKPQGALVVDAGAAHALSSGKSLLPAGVTEVNGQFGRGDPIEITDGSGHRLGQGLSAYSSEEARRIKGHHSRDIEPILGYPGRTALVHRDDMAL